MDIFVELDNAAERKEIVNELGILGEASQHFRTAFTVQRIVVPDDFDAKVNELQGSANYRSTPGMEPVSRTIPTREGYVLLFHPMLYTSSAYDNHVRYAIYWHEFTLLVNRSRFPVLLRHKLDRFANYFVNLYQLYDHYCAARRSFEFRDAILSSVLKEQLSSTARTDLERSLAGSLALLRNKAEYYDWIRFQIMEFREHGNVNDFLEQVRDKITRLSFSLIYAYATMDHYADLRHHESLIADAPMLNGNTRAFLEYLRLKYQEDAVDLTDGIDLMEALWANFGVRFVDGERLMECEVLDI